MEGTWSCSFLTENQETWEIWHSYKLPMYQWAGHPIFPLCYIYIWIIKASILWSLGKKGYRKYHAGLEPILCLCRLKKNQSLIRKNRGWVIYIYHFMWSILTIIAVVLWSVTSQQLWSSDRFTMMWLSDPTVNSIRAWIASRRTNFKGIYPLEANSMGSGTTWLGLCSFFPDNIDLFL